MGIKLTDATLRALEPPAAGNRITYDPEVPGFGARITTNGAKSFVLNYRVAGRERRITIGSYPAWTVAAAREQAKLLRRRVDQGQDPMGERHAERAAPTVADMAERYLAEGVSRKRPRSVIEDKSLLNQLVLPALGKLRVAAVRRADIEAFHRDVSKTTPVRANRAHSLLRRMFNLSIGWEWVSVNPCTGIERNFEDNRERFLSPDELRRLLVALDECRDRQSANAIRLCLLTGARRGEVLNAEWPQFDLTPGGGIWTKPASATKQRRSHRIPLNAAARALLGRMRPEATGPRLFPGRRENETQADLKRTWAAVCKRAEISDLRLHDLRHSYASFLASAGLSLPIIGQLLGHSSLTTTARYSHLLDDPLRVATEKVGAIVTAAGSAEVVPMSHRRRS
jgi:integrase